VDHTIAGIGPAATTVPSCGFSFAVSGMMMPPAVFSSAGEDQAMCQTAKMKFLQYFLS